MAERTTLTTTRLLKVDTWDEYTPGDTVHIVVKARVRSKTTTQGHPPTYQATIEDAYLSDHNATESLIEHARSQHDARLDKELGRAPLPWEDEEDGDPL